MTDTGARLRALFEQIAPPIEIGAVMSGAEPIGYRRRGWLIAAAAAGITLLVGVGAWLLIARRGSEPPVVTGPTTTTVAPTTTAATTTTAAPAAGSAWSRVPSDEAVFGGPDHQRMWSVVVGGPGLVAVGEDGSHDERDAAVWASADGLAWSRVPSDETVFGGPGRQMMWSVVVGGPGLVAVGEDGSGDDWDAAVWVSADGLAWSRVPPDETVFGGPDDQVMRSVVVGGPGLVAVGWDGEINSDAAVWVSADGLAWSRVSDDETVFGGYGDEMLSVVVGGPGLVAVGGDWSGGGWDAAVWSSADGLAWSRVPPDEAVFGGPGNQEMTSVVVGGPGLVAVGWDVGDAAVWVSADGLAWSRVPPDEAALRGPEDQVMTSVVVGGPGLVAVGWDTSGDGADAEAWLSPPPG